MILSEVSVRRPVLAIVISSLLTIIGLMAASRLAVREYPDISAPIVGINTSYRGASSSVVESKITRIIENQVAGIEGIEKLTSSSSDERSRVTIEFGRERDVESAANDVRERVARVQAMLPQEADPPQITKFDSSGEPTITINITSEQRSVLDLTDYANRYLLDRFSVVNGVAMARINGERRYAMRIWLDRAALAARQITVQNIEDTLRRENVELPAGRIESSEREFTLRTETGFRTEENFRQLVIGRGADGYLVRLGEIATVKRDAEDMRSLSRSNGKVGIAIAIVANSTANVLDVSKGVRAELANLQAALPPDINAEINVDWSVFVSESIKEVIYALVIAMLLVLVVIYAFLGTVRATLIPAVAIPVSLIAACIVMAFFGYSINTLTLLGAVLAIGLVVDDAIVVLENIVRRIEHGEPPLLACVDGSKEIGFAVVATTLVLVAVFLPISFMQGNLGRLFGEFGITIAAAVAFSAIVALTMVPMMSSKLFAKGIVRGRVVEAVDKAFKWLAAHYERAVRKAVAMPYRVVAVGLCTVALAVILFRVLPNEYAPIEDRAMVQIMVNAPEGASLQYLDRYMRQVEDIAMQEVTKGNAARILMRGGSAAFGGEANSGRVMMPLNSWEDRDESAQQIVDRLRRKFQDMPGVRVIPVLPGGLGQRGPGGGAPLRVVIGGPSYEELQKWRDKVLVRASENQQLTNLDSDYYERKPLIAVSIDRDRAADLGVSLTVVGRTLETMMGSRVVTTFQERGEEYNVILQAREGDRATPSDLNNIYVRSDRSPTLIPLSNLVKVEELAAPSDLKRFDRLRAITISAGLVPGYTLGEALDYMDKIIREELPPEAQIRYDGESRELRASQGALYTTFLLALVIVFLVLAAQFESFRHPAVIIMTVPLAVTGALLGLWITDSSINVFSQIGIVMLIGLAAKNGILIVEFANQLRDRDVEFVEAIVRASVTRLRPVLMTSLCTVFGALPLLVATGAGAESRQSIGAVVVYGVTFSMLLTLIVVPAVYMLIAKNSHSPEYIAHLIDKLRTKKEPVQVGVTKEPA
ncbi:MAG: efflux RND transporter permease subunit [Candidatus Obscuribacterales bacterium]|nr:efflux RND transporter permease subunit [Steroidobacteraceae bacterium]